MKERWRDGGEERFTPSLHLSFSLFLFLLLHVEHVTEEALFLQRQQFFAGIRIVQQDFVQRVFMKTRRLPMMGVINSAPTMPAVTNPTMTPMTMATVGTLMAEPLSLGETIVPMVCVTIR